MRNQGRRSIRAVMASITLVAMVGAGATAGSQPDPAGELVDYYGDLLGPEVGGITAWNVQGTFYDNFTNGDASLDGFRIQAVGGVDFSASALNPDEYLALEMYGIEPGEITFTPPDGPFDAGTMLALLQGDLTDAPAEIFTEVANYAYDPTASAIPPDRLFDGSFLSDPRVPDGLGDAYAQTVNSLSPAPPGFAGNAWFGPGGVLGCGSQTSDTGQDYVVHCGPSDPGGTQFGTDWSLFSMTLDNPLSSMGTEAEAVWGFWLDTIPVWMGPVSGDFFNYSNLNFSFQQAGGSNVILRFDLQDNAWNTTETHARVIEGGNGNYTLLVPSAELMPTVNGVRFNTFKAEGPRQPGSVSSMTHPQLSEEFVPPADFGTYTFTSDFGLSAGLEEALSTFASQVEPTPTPTPTASPTPDATATPAEEEPTPTPATTSAPDDDDGLNLGWVALGLGVLILLGGAYLVFFDKKGDCEPLRKAWLAAKAKADASAARATALEAECDGLNAEAEALEVELDAQCDDWPPACRSDSIEESGDPSSRITTLDLQVRREWASHQWGEYRAGNLSAEEAGRAREEMPPPEFDQRMRARDAQEKATRQQTQRDLAAKQAAARQKCAEAARARAEAAADAAAAARAEARYLECIGKAIEAQAQEAEAARLAEEQRQSQLRSGGGGPVSNAPQPPETGSSCDGEPDVRTQRERKRGFVLLGVEFGIQKQQRGLLGDVEREAVVNELADLEDSLGTLGQLLSGASAGKNLYKGNRARAAGDVATGAAGIPTNLPQAIATLLQTIAAVAQKAAEFANAVDAANSLYDVVFKTTGKWVTATVWEVKYCEDGVWKCRTELELEWSATTTRNRSKTDFTRRAAQREAAHARRALDRSRAKSQEMLEFIDANRPGPC